MSDLSKYDDMVNANDIDARIDEIETEMSCAFEAAVAFDFESVFADGVSTDDVEELRTLRSVRDQASAYSNDWRHGVTLISDRYFKQYAMDYAEESAGVSSSAWPFTCIDWDKAAAELRTDWTSIDFDGETFWLR